jgi:hypothetical protein
MYWTSPRTHLEGANVYVWRKGMCCIVVQVAWVGLVDFVNHQTFGRCNKTTLNNVEVFVKQF